MQCIVYSLLVHMNSLKFFLEEASTCKMIGAIKDFIFLMEASNHTNENYAPRLHVALVALYEAGLHFKEIHLSDDCLFNNDLPIHFVDKNTVLICSFLEELNARNNLFKKTFEKYNESKLNTTKQADLVDFGHSLYYMYKQLKTQVVKIEHRSSNAMAEDGLWQIKNAFYTGWGKDCAKAIEVLHAFRY